MRNITASTNPHAMLQPSHAHQQRPDVVAARGQFERRRERQGHDQPEEHFRHAGDRIEDALALLG